MEKWIPVTERLPESEAVVLCKFPTMQRVAMYVGAFALSTDERRYEGDADYCEATDSNYWPEGWYCYEDGMELWMATCSEPSHWMLLPETPNKRDQAAP